MKLDHIPFVTTDWQHVAREPKPAQAGQAFWRTQQFGEVRVRIHASFTQARQYRSP